MSGLSLDTPVSSQDADEKVSKTTQIEMRWFRRAKTHCAKALHAVLRRIDADEQPQMMEDALRDLCLDWLVDATPEN